MEAREWTASDSAVAKALTVIEGVNAPLAEWRVRATAARLHEQRGRAEKATQNRRRGLEVLNLLADSLDETDRLRASLLGSLAVQNIRLGS